MRHRVIVPLILNNMLKVCEIFKSIQGESTFAGRVCSFVRLTGCNLRCSYCDTQYAFTDGADRTVDYIVNEIEKLGCRLVEITGGEPLIQKETPALCSILLDKKYTVLVETNGSQPINLLPEPCIRIVDIKCPGSGQENSFLIDNIGYLHRRDEIKCVITDRRDFEWALEYVNRYSLHEYATVLFSPCIGKIDISELAGWIIESNAQVRLGVQIHKFIWGDKRGV